MKQCTKCKGHNIKKTFYKKRKKVCWWEHDDIADIGSFTENDRYYSADTITKECMVYTCKDCDFKIAKDPKEKSEEKPILVFEPMVLNGYSVTPCGKNHATHAFYLRCIHNNFGYVKSLNECKDLCMLLTNPIGDGYETQYAKGDGNINLGPIGAVQMSIRKFYGEGVYFININKIDK